MQISTIVRLAFSRILASKTRSLLTMLGVIIGVASLVTLTSVATGATSGITSSLSSLGAQQISVSGNRSTALTESDAAALRSIAHVSAVSTTVTGQGTVTYDGTESKVSITGVSDSYVATQDPDVAVGAFLPVFTNSNSARTAVLSAQTANDLGVTADDVGAELFLDGVSFTVVGVLDDANGFNATGTIYVSQHAARSLFSQAPYVQTISVLADSSSTVAEVQADVNASLRSRYSLTADDDAAFTVTNQSSLLSTLDSVSSTLTFLLAGISSISLVVGGIGIMNIMLVSVRERTREIGIRRAIGARRRHILVQFVIEAVALSTMGGIVGLGVGIGASAIVTAVAGWSFAISGGTVALALGFSIAVGIVFGVWPARTAARLQPVEALRFE